MLRFVSAILVVATLGLIAASPPKPPDARIEFAIETPLLWYAELRQGDATFTVTSLNLPMGNDPAWHALVEWEKTDMAPEESPTTGCFNNCIALCKPGTVKKAKYTASGPEGLPPPSCECECYPVPPTAPPPPPSKAAD